MRPPSGIDVETAEGTPPAATDEAQCNSEKIRVRLAPGVAEKAGVALAEVVKRKVSETIDANAETSFAGDAWARLSPCVAGTIVEVLKREGDLVEKGTPLAVLDSAQLAEAKSAYQKAAAVRTLREKTFEVERDLAAKGASSGNRVAEAETSLEEARIEEGSAAQRLANLGLSKEQVAQVEATKDTSGRIALVAPFSGTVVERTAVLGERADPSRVLFGVADLSTMWVTVRIYEADLPKVRVDQKVLFAIDGVKGRVFRGKVLSVGSAVDDRTRTVPVRAALRNKDGLLRANMFGRAQVVVHDQEEVVVVPREAVQWEGCHWVVFVESGPGIYQTRKVQRGWEGDGYVEVLQGIVPGDKVVTTGSFLMKTEILKGLIGGGCCD